MFVIPAIDLKGGKCVRLVQGKAEAETVYSDDPVAVAQRWESLGAKRIHVVDLDGAFAGRLVNWNIIEEIRKKTKVSLELGGGLRSMEEISRALDSGIDYAVLGSVFVTDPVLAREVVGKYTSRIIAAMDCFQDKVVIHGWIDSTELTVFDLGRRLISWGVTQMIYTDVSRDGMLKGPNIEAVRSAATGTGLWVIASGGVSGVADVKALAGLEPDGVIGMIIGKALYDGALDLKEAISAVGA